MTAAEPDDFRFNRLAVLKPDLTETSQADRRTAAFDSQAGYANQRSLRFYQPKIANRLLKRLKVN